MMSIQIGPKDDGPADDLATQGVWWLRGSDRKPVPGTATFTSSGPVRLDLLDHLCNETAVGPQVIYGRQLGGKKIMLLKAQLRFSAPSWDRADGDSSLNQQAWEAGSYLSGGHLDDPESAKFSAIMIETRRLARWTGIPMAREESPSEHQMVLTVEIPRPIVAVIPGIGSVNLSWGSRQIRMPSEVLVRLEVTPYWHIELDAPRTMAELERDILNPLLLWMTFVTGAGDRFGEISLRGSTGSEDDDEVLFWHTRLWSDDLPQRVEPSMGSYLLPLERIMADLPTVLAGWFEMYRRAGRPMMEFMLRSLRSESGYLEEEFLGVMRSAESFHRLMYGGVAFPPNVFDKLINGVLEKVEDEKQRDHLSLRLMHANELTLRKRLTGLVDGCSPVVRDLASQRENKRLISRAIELRDGLTHGDVDAVSVATFAEMFSAITLLDVIMTSRLLKACGLDDVTVDDCLRNSYAWGWVEALVGGVSAH